MSFHYCKAVDKILTSSLVPQRVFHQDQLINSIAGHSPQDSEPDAARTAGTERSAYVLSPSKSFNTPRTPPSGASPRKGQHRAESTSYFGATPPPLPIAPGMTFNSSRKSRRITIEQDIGRLNCESRTAQYLTNKR